MNTIKRLLVANRGEIACRIMRSARMLGIETVAVYSEADAEAPHVKMADASILIGPAPATESYLVIEKIIKAAQDSNADAIHPGYGFLSENASFARACADAGIIFVGPPERAITVMGDKARAKRAMIEAGVPCAPGYQGEDQSLDTLAAEAKKIGFPLMVKAAAGGGGRGMRLVHDAGELENAIQTAKSEALNAFGDDNLILEKAIVRPRHVEFQVFGDTHGNIIHLGERDCSVQRRHQKVIEEAPCPVMTEELRATMGEAAISAAREVDYTGAGTVEFLLGEDGAFYFLEMNTRLQVEHPVTEEITGLDLVELQLRVAAGMPIGVTQDDIAFSGHAIEVRLCAEEPENDFLPSTGPIEFWRKPQGAGVRVDAGVEAGGEVSPYYDSMIAKVIAAGATRDEATKRLTAALETSALFGVATNRDFLIDALNRSQFRAGKATTAFIAEEYGDAGFENTPAISDFCKAAVINHEQRKRKAYKKALGIHPELLDWSSTGGLTSVSTYKNGDAQITATVSPTGENSCSVSASGETMTITVSEMGADTAMLECNGYREPVVFFSSNETMLHVATTKRQFTAREATANDAENSAGDGIVAAPMHGLVTELFVEENQPVKKGEQLAILEAMKMQHEIVADIDGAIAAIHAQTGVQIGAGETLFEIKPDT